MKVAEWYHPRIVSELWLTDAKLTHKQNHFSGERNFVKAAELLPLCQPRKVLLSVLTWVGPRGEAKHFLLLLHPIIPLPPATQPATNLTRGMRRRTSLGPSRSGKLTNLKRLHISILLYLSPRHPPRNPRRLGSPFRRMLPKWRLRERRDSPGCKDKMRGSLLWARDG